MKFVRVDSGDLIGLEGKDLRVGDPRQDATGATLWPAMVGGDLFALGLTRDHAGLLLESLAYLSAEPGPIIWRRSVARHLYNRCAEDGLGRMGYHGLTPGQKLAGVDARHFYVCHWRDQWAAISMVCLPKKLPRALADGGLRRFILESDAWHLVRPARVADVAALMWRDQRPPVEVS